MAEAGSTRRIVRMRVVNSDIHRIAVDEDPYVSEGFIMCTEYLQSEANEIDNQNLPQNQKEVTWRVLIPHYLSDNTKTPSPNYAEGDSIYAAKLDNPIVISNPSDNTLSVPNDHPSVNGVAGYVPMIPSRSSFSSHYGRSPEEGTVNPKTDVVFWIDLNVDGRTTGTGGGGGGTASVVWL